MCNNSVQNSNKRSILLCCTKERVWVNKPKAKSTRQLNSSETLMTIAEWGRREARSKSRGHSYFITKVFGRKETETKINLDLGVFYEPLREDLRGKRFSLSVCLSVCLSACGLVSATQRSVQLQSSSVSKILNKSCRSSMGFKIISVVFTFYKKV